MQGANRYHPDAMTMVLMCGLVDVTILVKVLYYPGHQSTYYYNGDGERIKVVTKYVQYDE